MVLFQRWISCMLVITSEQDGYTPKCDRSLVLVLTKTLTFREGGGLALRRPAPKPPSGVAQLLRSDARICPPSFQSARQIAKKQKQTFPEITPHHL